jgi:hypothetical protein
VPRALSAVVVASGLLLSACGPPTLNATSSKKLARSLDHIESSLEPAELEAYRDALAYLTDDTSGARDPESMEHVLAAYQPLQGKTAAETIAQARQLRIQALNERISELDARSAASAAARQMTSRLEISEIRLFRADGSTLERPVIEVAVKNHSHDDIFKITLQASLRHRDEIEPRVVEIVDCPFEKGFPRGRRTRARAELQAPEWGQAGALGDKAVLLCGILRIYGVGGKVIVASDYGPADEALRLALQHQLQALLTPGS